MVVDNPTTNDRGIYMPRLNSWTRRRSSIRVLGQVSTFNENMEQRLRYGQIGTLICTSCGLITYIIEGEFLGGSSIVCAILEGIFGLGFFFSMGMIFYKNISFLVLKRLLKEVNVLVILLTGIAIFCLDCLHPQTSLSPALSSVYLSCVFLFVFMDSLKIKSRVFVLVCGSLFAILTWYNVYNNTMSTANIGIIVFRYNEQMFVEKRALFRSFFLQIFLFSLNALFVMFIDKDMKYMMNGTGYIYRETGTGSEYDPSGDNGVEEEHTTTQRI
jgi:hypothetical protein